MSWKKPQNFPLISYTSSYTLCLKHQWRIFFFMCTLCTATYIVNLLINCCVCSHHSPFVQSNQLLRFLLFVGFQFKHLRIKLQHVVVLASVAVKEKCGRCVSYGSHFWNDCRVRALRIFDFMKTFFLSLSNFFLLSALSTMNIFYAMKRDFCCISNGNLLVLVTKMREIER